MLRFLGAVETGELREHGPALLREAHAMVQNDHLETLHLEDADAGSN